MASDEIKVTCPSNSRRFGAEDGNLGSHQYPARKSQDPYLFGTILAFPLGKYERL
jgi:hypothetical protein